MNKNKKPSLYNAPAATVVAIELRGIVALSVNGGTESYSSSEESQQTEGFNNNEMGDF